MYYHYYYYYTSCAPQPPLPKGLNEPGDTLVPKTGRSGWWPQPFTLPQDMDFEHFKSIRWDSLIISSGNQETM